MGIVRTGRYVATLLDHENQVVFFDTCKEACDFAERLVGNRSAARYGDLTLYGYGDGATSIMVREEMKITE